MKKHLPLAAVAATALVLAGCAAGTEEGPSASPSPTGSPAAGEMTDFGMSGDVATVEDIAWEEDAEGIPSLTFDTPSTLTSTTTRILEEGEGDPVQPGQIAVVDYTLTSGTDGTQLYSTYDEDTPEPILVSQGSLDPVLYNALTGTGLGGDLIFGTLDQTSPDNPNAAIYMAITISDVVQPLPRAEGTAVDPAEGLPAITLDEESGAPAVEIGEAEMPTELVVQPLIEGPADGETVDLGETVVAHYTGWVWDGEQFDSSWDRGEPTLFSFAEGQLIEGWTQGLAGQTVGSQVLLVIPPELAYGEQESEAIPAGSTLVFVVDILAVV